MPAKALPGRIRKMINEALKKRLLKKYTDLATDKKYQIIYADPPWQFKNYNDNTATNWVGSHYGLMD